MYKPNIHIYAIKKSVVNIFHSSIRIHSREFNDISIVNIIVGIPLSTMARQTIFDRPPHLYSKELTSAPFYINSLNERDISTDSQFHRSLTSRFELVIAASSANIV